MKVPAGLPGDLGPKMDRLRRLSAEKIKATERAIDPAKGSPVFTVGGKWTSRGWTEWTQGFQYGSAILQFDATGDEEFLALGRERTVTRMAPHVTHMGVHDHGFNNISTYGNLLRLMNEGRITENAWERAFYELALKASGAVQARRWSRTADGGGFIYSFNGPHSLFVDTIRSLRSLAVAHLLGHSLLEENDLKVSLLERLVMHARATARYCVYYGEGRDSFDVPGRVAHESIFNTTDGKYRCPSTQQGYSPFTTWTRGLAWAILGFAEEYELLAGLPEAAFESSGGKAAVLEVMMRALRATADFYIANTAADGIPYWDTGAPGLEALGDWRSAPADPFNAREPVDSSAAAIACQGLMRLGAILDGRGKKDEGGGAQGRAGARGPAPDDARSKTGARGPAPEDARSKAGARGPAPEDARSKAGARGPASDDARSGPEGVRGPAPEDARSKAGVRGPAPEDARSGSEGERYFSAGLSVFSRLLEEPYISLSPDHHGLLLHSVYHRPNGWDHVPPGRSVPCGESSMWGDYHLREAALYAARRLHNEAPPVFWRMKR